MARITELNTKAILYILGSVNSSTSNAMQRLKDLTPQQRQVVMTETYAEYNLRTGSNLRTLSWDGFEQARQNEYDQERSVLITSSNSTLS